MWDASAITQFIGLWLLVTASPGVTARSRRGRLDYCNCLSNFKARNVNSTSVKLTWNFKCVEAKEHEKVRYKISYKHQAWLACGNEKRDRKRITEIDDTKEFTLDHLHSYSDYNIEIKAIPNWSHRICRPDESEIKVTTEEDIPGVAPTKSLTAIPSINTDKITFFWRPPTTASCQDFNGILDGYKYTLKGLDKWNKDDEYSGETTPDVTRKVFEGLNPMSNYILHVFAKNNLGQINKSLPLNLRATTHPSNQVETPPRHLKAILSKESLHLSWLPPYPPTSPIAKYIVRWKVENENRDWNKWDHRFEVVPDRNSCEKAINPELMCHIIQNFTSLINKVDLAKENSDPSTVNFGEEVETKTHSQISFGKLDLSKNITFQISAMALKQQHVPRESWSKRVVVTTEVVEPNPETGTGKIAIAVIVSIVVVFFLILLVICVRHKCNQNVLRNGHHNKGNYKYVPPYESQYNGQNPPSLQTQPSIMSELSDVTPSVTTSWNQHQQPSVEFRRSLPPPQRIPYRNSKISNSAQSSTLPRNVESNSKNPKTKNYSHILLPLSPSQTQSPPSIIGTPLPPIPFEEPIYDELQHDTMLKDNDKRLPMDVKRLSLGNTNTNSESNNHGTVNKISTRKKSEGFESEDDFLEPVDVSLRPKDGDESDDNDYLAPTTREKRPNTIDNLFRKSCSDIGNTNEDEYLKPTFNQFDRINSRDLSPPHEKPPPIPMQSYTSFTGGKERIIPIQIEKN